MDVLLFTTRLAIIACRHMVPYYYRCESVKIPEIAEVYGFKARSINPAFTALVKSGVLSSQVGGRFDNRGFIFAKDPKEVSLYDIVEILEGDAQVPSCSTMLKCQPANCNDCSIHTELQQVVDIRKKLLSATTIYDQYENSKTL